jgi:hypothetical protein
MSGKVPFGGDAWLAALQNNLAELAASAGPSVLTGASVKILEIVTDVPAELADPTRPDGSRAWHIVIEGGKAWAAPGEIETYDFGSISDYEGILRLARWVYSTDESDRAAVAAHREELERDGLFKPLGARPEMSPELGAMLTELHNRLARITA